MDYERVEHTGTIPGTAGHQMLLMALATDGREHDRAYDLLQAAELSGPWGPGQTVHANYAVYRNGPGWQQLRAALAGDSAEIAAAHGWWTRQRDTAPYAGYRLLTAIDLHGPCPLAQATDALQLSPATDMGHGLYGRALRALQDLNLVQVYRDGRHAIAPDAEDVIRPARRGGAWSGFRQAMQATLGQPRPGSAPHPAALANAFETPGQARHTGTSSARSDPHPTRRSSPQSAPPQRGTHR
ncbi:MAG: hypothetical protein V7603_5067 [Micromonosporaceae bacterium]